MLEGILWALICFFAFIGLLTCVQQWEQKLQRENPHPFLMLVPLRGQIKNVELILREGLSFLEGREEQGVKNDYSKLRKDSESLAICRIFCRDFHCVRLVEKQQFYDIIEEQVEQML